MFIAPHSKGAHYNFSAQIPSMASYLLGAKSESLLIHELPECLPPSLLSPSVSPTFLPSLWSSFPPAQRAGMLPPLGFCSCHDFCLESVAPTQSPVCLPPSFPFIFFHRSFQDSALSQHPTPAATTALFHVYVRFLPRAHIPSYNTR